MRAPHARAQNKEFHEHGIARVDPFYWLNERDNPHVKKLLESENEYLEHELQDVQSFREGLYLEMKSRIKEEEDSVPCKKDGYWFYNSYEKGDEYARMYRKKDLKDVGELIVDLNQRAQDSQYYSLGTLAFSQDDNLFAVSEDRIGRRNYDIQFLKLSGDNQPSEVIQKTTGSIAWSADGNYIFYVKKDRQTLRPYQVYRHVLNTHPAEDKLVYQEDNEAYYINVYRSKSKKYIMIGCSSTLTTHFALINADSPLSEFKEFQKREAGVEYYPAHAGDSWVVKTNKNAPNYQLELFKDDSGKGTFVNTIVKHSGDSYIEDVELFANECCVLKRTRGLREIIVYDFKTLQSRTIPFDEETYTLGFGTNTDFNHPELRVFFSSLTTPTSTIDIRLSDFQKEVKKTQEVLGSFVAENYVSKRIWIKGHDGVDVAISMVCRREIEFKNAPTLLYAYGSYGHTIDPYFSSTRLSLLDRGFIFAIAHIRGGSYLGKEWYNEGKMFAKKNTFLDFIACGEQLIQRGISKKNELYAMGGSAGGLLMGVIANLRPTLFKGIVNQVGFLDVVTTMMDETIPLTTGEYDEWGNPNNEDSYHYMLSYSPYDNIDQLPYPEILLTTGFHDSQVQYWEPAKYLYKLRMNSISRNKAYLHTNFDAGHGGSSGRFEYLKEIALEYAFLLRLSHITQ